MKKGDILEGKVIRTEFPNKGILEIEDTKIIVKNALAGQTIRFSISKKRKDKVEGRLMEVLVPSELECDENGEACKAACPHFGICGGCAYQNLPYENQLALKKAQVELLIKNAGFDFPVDKINGSPLVKGYRNKMEFTFGDEYINGPLALGMHKKDSFYDIVSLTDCQITDPDYNIIIAAVLNYFRDQGVKHYHRMRHDGFLRHLVVRRAACNGDILINLVTSSQGTLDADTFVEAMLGAGTNGKIAGILHTINDSVADVVQSDETKLLYGQDYIYEQLFDLKFKITPFSFFQTNSKGAEVLYDTVRSYVGETKDKLIYDLYTGTGTIAQILAPVAKEVVGVEIVEEAVIAARKNAEDNGLTNCRFIAGDVMKELDNLTEKPDILVLDPPRDGINPRALNKILSYQMDEIVYVSCKPTSLMRDLQVFYEAGYRVEKCSLTDMFPGTRMVETVVLLSKGEIDSNRI